MRTTHGYAAPNWREDMSRFYVRGPLLPGLVRPVAVVWITYSRSTCRDRSCGHPGQVQPPGAVLDEHQHVQPLEQHLSCHQEVARDDRVGLLGQIRPGKHRQQPEQAPH